MPRQPLTDRDGMPRTRARRLSESIRAGMVIRKLCDHVEDAEAHPMTATQVAAARTLLNKVCPDLKAVEMSGSDGHGSDPYLIPASTLARIIEGESERVTDNGRLAPPQTNGGGGKGQQVKGGRAPVPAQHAQADK